MGPGSQTGSNIIEGPPPPVNRMTHASKNMTLPQTSFADGNESVCTFGVQYTLGLFVFDELSTIYQYRKLNAPV